MINDAYQWFFSKLEGDVVLDLQDEERVIDTESDEVVDTLFTFRSRQASDHLASGPNDICSRP